MAVIYSNDFPNNSRRTTTLYTDASTDLGTTIYGGTLDLVSGVLTVNMAEIESYTGETLPGAWISSLDEYQQGATPTTGAQVVYELATPYTVQLTPTQVRSLLGTNNVWSDSGEMAKIIYNKGNTTLSLTIADLYNIIANLDARVKELEGEDEVDLSTMSDKDLDEMPEEEEVEEETAEENE